MWGKNIKYNSEVIHKNEKALGGLVYSHDPADGEKIKLITADQLTKMNIRLILLKTNGKSNALIKVQIGGNTFLKEYIINSSSFLMSQIMSTFGENNVYLIPYSTLLKSNPFLKDVKYVMIKNKIVRVQLNVLRVYDLTEDESSENSDPQKIEKDVDEKCYSMDSSEFAHYLVDSIRFLDDLKSFSLAVPQKGVSYTGEMIMFLGATQSGKSTSINNCIYHKGKGIYKLDPKSKISYIRIGEPEITFLPVDKMSIVSGSLANWLDVFEELVFGSEQVLICDSGRTLGRLSSFNLMATGVSSDIIDIMTFLPSLTALMNKKFILVHNPMESDPEKLKTMMDMFHASIKTIYYFPTQVTYVDTNVIAVNYSIYSRISENKSGLSVNYKFLDDDIQIIEEISSSITKVAGSRKKKFLEESITIVNDVSSSDGSDEFLDNEDSGRNNLF